VIEKKYLDMFARLKNQPIQPIAPLPGWMARRRRDVPAAAQLLATIPSGALLPEQTVVRDRTA
jgi:hypothetical protein